MYDGVHVHGLVHQMRMEDVFWTRQRILVRMLDLVVAALPAPTDPQRRDLMATAWRELTDTIFAGRAEDRKEREKAGMAILQREANRDLQIQSVEEVPDE